MMRVLNFVEIIQVCYSLGFYQQGGDEQIPHRNQWRPGGGLSGCDAP
ncbi:hypothetical protein [Parabacteroides johnsonii]